MKIYVNQLGYLPVGSKIAVFAFPQSAEAHPSYRAKLRRTHRAASHTRLLYSPLSCERARRDGLSPRFVQAVRPQELKALEIHQKALGKLYLPSRPYIEPKVCP